MDARNFLFGILILSLSACGYTFQGSGSILPPEVKKIYIPVVENQSTETGYSIVLTEALRDEFERYGVLTVVESAREADAVLNATIKSVKNDTAGVTSKTDTALQYSTVVTLGAELRRSNGRLLWRDPALRVSKIIGAVGDTVVTSSADFASGGLNAADIQALGTREVSRGQQQEALEDLAVKVAQQVYSDAVAPDF